MSRTECVYVGIDVAFAKKKPLPVCVCRRQDGKLKPLALKADFKKPPVGRGNRAALEKSQREQFAKDVLDWLRDLERFLSLQIVRIAIDSPSDYCHPDLRRRRAEQALDEARISCFTTPTEKQFGNKINTCKQFLQQGGKLSRLPNANQLWMLIGFALFKTIGKEYECVETFPQAIVRELPCSTSHKSTKEGLAAQIGTTAAVMGYDWRSSERNCCR